MNIFDEKIVRRLEELVAAGEELLSATSPTGLFGEVIEDLQGLRKWHTSCRNFLSRVVGEGSTHFKAFPDMHVLVREVEQMLGVMQSIKDDIEAGFMFDKELLISADVFDDILEQADHLLRNKYGDAAASLIGASLESTLRKLCVKRRIQLSGKETLEPLNELLVKDGAYNQVVKKRITALGAIRNNADHGHHDQYKQSDVEDMLKWVRDFIGEYLK